MSFGPGIGGDMAALVACVTAMLVHPGISTSTSTTQLDYGAPRTDLGDEDGDEEEQGGRGYSEGQEGGRSVKTDTTPSSSVWL